MKYYLLSGRKSVRDLTAILEADGVKNKHDYPDYIEPINPKVFWARSKEAWKDAESKMEVIKDFGYESSLTMNGRQLIKVLFTNLRLE